MVSPLVPLPTDEKGNRDTTTTTISKDDGSSSSSSSSSSSAATTAHANKIEEEGVQQRRPSSYNSGSSMDASALPNGGSSSGDRIGDGGGGSPETVKVRSSSADSTALDLIVQQLSLQHNAELSASSLYIKRDTIDESGNYNSNNNNSNSNNGERRSGSIISRSSNVVDHASGVLQSPRISIVFRNTSDRFESSSASFIAQGQNDADSNCDSNSQRSVDIASRLVEAITGSGTASGRGSVRLTLSRTIPENQGMVKQGGNIHFKYLTNIVPTLHLDYIFLTGTGPIFCS